MPLTLVPTPIGNLDDVSDRIVSAIQSADIVFCEDTRVTKKLFMLLCERRNLQQTQKKFIPLHSHNEDTFLQTLDVSLFSQQCIYLSDAGMPGISDPGAKLVLFAQEHNISYDVLPGPSALPLVYAASGLTDSQFFFYGFLPHKASARQEELAKICTYTHPVIFYEAPHRITDFAAELAKIDPAATIFAAKELTKLHQAYIKTDASHFGDVLSKMVTKGEWALVVCFSLNKPRGIYLDISEISELGLPKKQEARLLSKITGRSPKEIYAELLQNERE